MKGAARALVGLGVAILVFTAAATLSEIRSGVITRRPFVASSGVVADRAQDPGQFWTQIGRRVAGVGLIAGTVIAIGRSIRSR